jgi:bifunctional UDP-N-acetylglucosamine pyrophosphorylase/glucosamine-1-phosphate N-acetyltransferase
VPGDAGPTLDGRLLGATAEEVAALLDGGGPRLLRRVRPEELPEVERTWVSRRLRVLAASGVRLVDPERIWVEATVEVARGAVLWGGCVLRGKTRIGAGAVIHPGAVLDDTEVGAGSEVKAYSVCTGARIGPGCTVGPMAHLRAGTVLHEDVKVGNFVEVKQAELRRGARASHLTYLGDADVGEGANIGAGTITCNYDGFGKHRTEIGAGAFVGSNTSLVAPVRIGAGAIVGAGSTVTREVPDEALMVERAEERVLEGRAPRVRARNQARARRE